MLRVISYGKTVTIIICNTIFITISNLEIFIIFYSIPYFQFYTICNI